MPGGWIDTDVPNVFYASRRLARDARRNRLGNGHIAVVGYSSSNNLPAGGAVLNQLQTKLYDRLTQRQGVDVADAVDVITNNGYNKAASYGHMREAGATHSEANIVISLDSPYVSLTYGRLRSRGYDHTPALQRALND